MGLGFNVKVSGLGLGCGISGFRVWDFMARQPVRRIPARTGSRGAAWVSRRAASRGGGAGRDLGLCGVWGLGLRVEGLGFRVWGLGFRV